jgi:hypothetical protein
MGDLAGFLRRAQLPLLVMVLAAQAAEARFVVEKNSLMVTSPTKLRGRHDSAIGNFGIPQYGGSMAGAVVYPMDNADACDAFDGKHTFRAKTGALPTFLLVDRGSECSLNQPPDTDLFISVFARWILGWVLILAVVLGLRGDWRFNCN